MRKTLILMLMTAGCAAGSAAPRDPTQVEAGRVALNACRNFICQPRVEVTLQDRCMADRAERYGTLSDAKARRAYLVGAGCPEDVIDGRTVDPKPGS